MWINHTRTQVSPAIDGHMQDWRLGYLTNVWRKVTCLQSQSNHEHLCSTGEPRLAIRGNQNFGIRGSTLDYSLLLNWIALKAWQMSIQRAPLLSAVVLFAIHFEKGNTCEYTYLCTFHLGPKIGFYFVHKWFRYNRDSYYRVGRTVRKKSVFFVLKIIVSLTMIATRGHGLYSSLFFLFRFSSN